MKNRYLWLQMKSNSYDVANTVCGKQKLSVILRDEFEIDGYYRKHQGINTLGVFY